jgi:hypothetical protein
MNELTAHSVLCCMQISENTEIVPRQSQVARFMSRFHLLKPVTLPLPALFFSAAEGVVLSISTCPLGRKCCCHRSAVSVNHTHPRDFVFGTTG